ncbi:hypothetical protein SAMD00019534_001390 [Acytostelium subglobosum LB1]|uniref:hypothetical protein n=1 Tax=Acytostelium subglobosum LB1 TaxID=1410327 RepID=UPI0006451A21|nr:hypothetical protein SAMD00019534_001390 [Acytostelium subglobosum LB1]GAM16964.1 hypothetical protein SAMD00019534_001390 [Acytostelium subglobosum LB1]|eukprot:XP_012759026.1 hypothetical protein SAMD00019534_001390 [Acytostelium subglobosum LB1]
MNQDSTVIIDNGSGYIKAGFSGNNAPQSVFPSVLSKVAGVGGTNYYFGEDAVNMAGMMPLTYPIQRGVVNNNNWDDMTKIWEHTFSTVLNVQPSDRRVLLTEAPRNPKMNRERMAKIMFETFQTQALCIAPTDYLSLTASGRDTAIIIDSGYGVTNIVPYIDGVALKNTTHHAMGGRDVDNYMIELMSDFGTSLPSANKNVIASAIKDKLAYATQDCEADMKNQSKEAYTLPDGMEIMVGPERFLCTEGLFDPSLFSMVLAGTTGITQGLLSCINKADIDVRGSLCDNVIISGGMNRLRGMTHRIEKEVSKVAPRMKLHIEINRKEAAWVGGSILASKASFQESKFVTKSQYEEHGPSIIHEICRF